MKINAVETVMVRIVHMNSLNITKQLYYQTCVDKLSERGGALSL